MSRRLLTAPAAVAVVTTLAVIGLAVGVTVQSGLGPWSGGDEALASSGDAVGLPPLPAGTVVWRSLVLENTSDLPVELESVVAVDLPAQLEQVDARVYDAAVTDGVYTSWYEGAGVEADEPTGFDSAPVDEWTLVPGESLTTNDRYIMVSFRIAQDAAPGSSTIEQFAVTYTVEGRRYRQVLYNELTVAVN